MLHAKLVKKLNIKYAADYKVANMHGVEARVLMTNMRWFFEGVSLTNPDAVIEVWLPKSDKIRVNMLSLNPGLLEYLGWGINPTLEQKEAAKERLKEKLTEQLDVIIEAGTEFVCGDKILTLVDPAGHEISCLTNKRYNQPIKVKGFSNPRIPKDKDYLELDIQLELSYKTTWAKLRQFGVKTTTFGWKIKFIDPVTGKDVYIDYDFLLTMGALKGRTAEISAFAAAKGGAELNTSLGKMRYVETDPGTGEEVLKEIDLKDWNEIDEWRNANTRELYAQFYYSKTEYDHIKATDRIDDVVTAEEIDSKTMLLTVKIQVLECKLPMNIEVSLPREKTTKTSFTFEQLCSMCLQNRRLGEAMVKASEPYRQGVQGLIKMISQPKDPGKDVHVADLTLSDHLAQFKGFAKRIILQNDAGVLSEYAKVFKNGLVIETKGANANNKSRWFIDFNTVKTMSTFIGGSASDVAFDIVSFLRWLPIASGSGVFTEVHSRVMLMKKSTAGWLYAQAASSGIQKRLVRSAKGLGTGFTVRTMPLPELSHEQVGDNEWDCIPKIGFNPHDEGLQSLAADPFTGRIPQHYKVQPGEEGDGYEVGDFAPWKLDGELMMFSRTPMQMQIAAEIVLTTNVEVGHAALLGFIWSAANEGDSDGDTIVAALLAAFDITRDEALIMNAHAMGLRGYWIAYGMDARKHPSQEFYAYNDAWTKKALIVTDKIYAGLVEKQIMPHIAGVPMDGYLDMTQDVSKHYTRIVGTMYNISVFCSHMAVDLQYQVWGGNNSEKTQKELDVFMDLMPVAWRLLYEGTGLAGYTPGAWKFFKILEVSAYQDGWIETFDEDGNMEPGFPQQTTKKEELKGFDCLRYLGDGDKGGFSHLPNADAIVKKLILLHKVLIDGKALQNPNTVGKSNRVKNMMPGRREMAVMLWSLRLLSKGADPKAEEVFAPADEDLSPDIYDDIPEIPGISMIQQAESLEMWKRLSCPWLRDVYKNGLVHMNLANKFVVSYNNRKDED